MSNVGMCDCMRRVPAEFVVRDGRVYLHKQCPTCGPSEALVSSDAAAWQAKRDMVGYKSESSPCSMQCGSCNINHNPTVVFLEVTNRCNMNCPICITNVPGMGYDYHPPMEYFERVFQHLATFDPLPRVELFGGEPTVRDDLIDIINLGRKYDLRPRVVTNGIRLADEEYCAKLCKARVRFRLAIDGRNPEIYRRLRGNPGALDKKLKAIANLKKYSRRKHSLLCCAAKGVNDNAIADLIACCHENMEVFNELALLPLAETWDPTKFDGPPATTPEDAEEMIRNAVPGAEFIPAGLTHNLRPMRAFFRQSSLSDRLIFGGVHPNCESMTMLVSDGQAYRRLDSYYRISFKEMVEEGMRITRRINPRLARLDPTRPLQRLRGQLIVIRNFLPLARRAVDLKRLFRGHPVLNFLRMAVNVSLGRNRKQPGFFYRYMDPPRILGVVILPFEEAKTMDVGRLKECKAAFVYEDVDTGKIRTSPACTWPVYRDKPLRKMAEKYGKRSATAAAPASLAEPVKV